jgi:hypothetical protein
VNPGHGDPLGAESVRTRIQVALRLRLRRLNERVAFGLGELEPVRGWLACGAGDHRAADPVLAQNVLRRHELPSRLVLEHFDGRPPALAEPFEQLERRHGLDPRDPAERCGCEHADGCPQLRKHGGEVACQEV